MIFDKGAKREKNSLSINGAGKTGHPMPKNEAGPLISYTKMNSKRNKDLKVRAKIIILLKETIGGKLHDIGFGNDFLDMTPKVQATKEKYIKI